MNKHSNIIDPYVGKRVRNYRKKLGWTLLDLGQKLNVSPQQMQKYEQGRTRISAHVLYNLSLIMAVKPDYFFEGFEQHLNLPPNHYTDSRMPESRKRPIDILLVERDPSEALITRKAIEKAEIESNFHLLHTGRQALLFLRKEENHMSFPRPEIIILELNIPREDAYGTLRELKRDRRLCDIPVIILANSVERIEMMRAYQNNAAGFIRKPLSFKSYCEYINLMLLYWARVVTLPKMDSATPPPLEAELEKKEETSP